MIRLPLAMLLALAACAAQSPPPQVGRPADDPALSYGGLNQDIRVGDLTVRPLRVIEDNRCPIDVACIWAGRVVLRVRISGIAGVRVIDTTAPLALPQGGALVLEDVWPHRYQGARMTEPYHFGFRRR